MMSSFLKCGYSNEYLEKAKTKALSLNRDVILKNSEKVMVKGKDAICFILTHSVAAFSVQKFICGLLDDIELLTGTSNIIFSYKRNMNTASLLFNKYGFAQDLHFLPSQKCGTRNCASCVLKFPNNDPICLLPNLTVFPSKTANCKTENVTYVAICKLCNDFYFGKSINEEHVRMNGHRDKFDYDKFHRSALATHIFVDHLDSVGDSKDEGIMNYNVAILDSVNAINLRRKESYYIWKSEADLRHLNRYKIL